MKVKISVLIPVYNVEKYLRRCLDSVINQTYQNLEIILVDDGSTDRSGQICDEYKKKDNRIIVNHQQNRGISATRNKCLDISSGEYIGFIDSDDFINERMYEVLLKNSLEKNADLSICRYIRFSGEYVSVDKRIDSKISEYTSQEALNNLHGMDGQVYTVTWNKLYKRAVFEGLRYPLGKINEDEFITYKVIDRANKVVITDEVLYYYYMNVHSITSSPKNLINRDAFEAFEERKAYFLAKNNQDMIPVISKLYLDMAIARYKKLLSTCNVPKSDFNAIRNLYKEYYKNVKNSVPGIGYRIFNYLPRGYFTLVDFKNIIRK